MLMMMLEGNPTYSVKVVNQRNIDCYEITSESLQILGNNS